MALKLMYITNRPEIAQAAESAGVDRIFVDMEYIGKDIRQKGLDTVKSHHTIEDITKVRKALTKAELLVRVNPIHDETEEYTSSAEEIDAAIRAGAEIIMLPYFKTAEEVRTFIQLVGGRAKTLPLIETPEAVECIDEILSVQGIDEVFVGLNDLSLGYGKKFMFELLADGTIEKLCYKFRNLGFSYGFGGIASLGNGLLPAERIIIEHYRLGSTCAILSRSFCNTNMFSHHDVLSDIFISGIRDIRAFEQECSLHRDFFENNLIQIKESVREIANRGQE